MSLRDQARQRATQGTVATRDLDLKNSIRKMEEQFQLAMPKGMEARQLIRDAMTVLSQTPKLAECDSKSVLGALMTCSQLGLRPGVLGQAWILPFKGKGQLIIGYKGYATLAQRSGDIKSITARVIREKDYYDYEFGLDERLVHRPNMTELRGEPVAFYSVVKTQSGGTYWDLLSVPEMEDHRDRFAMGRRFGTIGKDGPYLKGVVQGPWVDDFIAMAKKTMVIKALNLAPASTELQKAFDVDGSTRFDLTPTANLAEVSVIEDDGRDADEAEIDPDEPQDPAEPSADEWARMNAGETAP